MEGGYKMIGLSIKTKIFGGFGLLTFAILGLALMSYASVRDIDDYFDDYRLTARQSVTSYQMAQDFLQGRSSALSFRSSRNPSVADNVEAEIAELIDRSSLRTELFAGSAQSEALQMIESNVIDYGNFFKEYREAMQIVENADVLAEEHGTAARRALNGRVRQAGVIFWMA